jgi:sensor c-di-GMP phosphodiesterase-like protein
MSGGFLVLALQYVRHSQLPAFDLERAIAAGELKPYYQPVINLRTGALAGCEVLCRWEKRGGEMVPPSTFIDYAEVTGLAIPMTLSLMQQVRQELSDLCREMPGIKISINLFDGHFRDGSLVEDVQAIFGDTPISFRQLVFEITERRPLDNTAQTLSVIGGLHALGARLAMDDAGTGHSNLAYLQTLGVDVIKIDKVFVDMIRPGATQVPVLDALIAMAHDLGTEIVAEGVETEEQAVYLRARGVVMAQGFLFAPAIAAEPFKELARALNGPAAAIAPPDTTVAA